MPEGPGVAVPHPGESVRGKRVVVTGGASGIGRAITEAFASVGARVAVFDRDQAGIDRLAKELPDVTGVVCDVSDAEDVASAFSSVDAVLGGIDVLVANAGISSRYAALDLPADEWRRMLDVNLNGVFWCAQEAGRRMAAAGTEGVILLMGSTNGITGHPNYAHYNAAKAGVIILAKTLALELAPSVRVNAICPGYVLTDMQRAEYTDEMLEAVNLGLPAKRHADPSEVALLYLFLASDWARYITGQAIVIDGGELA